MSTHIIPHFAQHWYLWAVQRFWSFFIKFNNFHLTQGKMGSSERRQPPLQVPFVGRGCLPIKTVKWYKRSNNVNFSTTREIRHTLCNIVIINTKMNIISLNLRFYICIKTIIYILNKIQKRQQRDRCKPGSSRGQSLPAFQPWKGNVETELIFSKLFNWLSQRETSREEAVCLHQSLEGHRLGPRRTGSL